MYTGIGKQDGERIMDSCQVFGVKIAAADLKEAAAWVCGQPERLKGQYITFANVHSVVMAHDSERYRKAQNCAAAVFADGHPVAAYQRKKGFARAKRVAGPDFMTEIFKISAEKGYRHYFYGSSEETLARLCENLKKKYPGIRIAGAYAPPYEKKLREDYGEDIARINESGADFVWIGLGAPKQEYWMYRQKGKVNGLMLGVGAGFDFHAGVVRRAPVWMQKCGLEWFYRLLQEPKRLGKRYVTTNRKFIRYVFAERTKRKEHGKN